MPVAGKILLSIKKPISIRIFDDIAVVHYTQEDIIAKNGKNTVHERTGWTDILKREGKRWVMIADHGGHIGANTGGQYKSDMHPKHGILVISVKKTMRVGE